jgi:RNA polymerase sigma-70 factor (ECF subfamily)
LYGSGSETTTTDDLLRRAKAGDAVALGALFAHHRDRPRKMVRLRLDGRVARRLDPSDVLQEAFLDVARRFPEYAAAPAVPFHVWLRALTA